MGHQKRRDKKKGKKYTVRGIDNSAVEAAAAASAQGTGAHDPKAIRTVSGAVPPCLTKLAALDAATREEGCQDVAHFALEADHQQLLLGHGAHHKLTRLLLDVNVEVRAAAAAALRNLLCEGSDTAVGDIVGADGAAGVLLQSLAELMDRQTVLIQELGPGELADEEEEALVDDGDAQKNQKQCDQPQQSSKAPQLRGVQRCLVELLNVCTVVCESSEAAAQIFAGTPLFLVALIDALLLPPASSHLLVRIALAAGELLRIITDENDQAAAFFTTGLTVEKQTALNSLTSPNDVPISPQLLTIRLHLCGVLLNVSANAANAQRIVPFITAGLEHLPYVEVSRSVPFLSDDCQAVESLRIAAVEQCQERLRALQASLDIASQLLSWICSQEHHGGSEDEDDEVAFARNPNALIFVASLIPTKILALLSNVFAPLDVVTGAALFQPSENAHLTSIQHLVLSSEVGLFSLASSLLMVVPVSSIGICDQIYRAAMNALRQRLELLSEPLATSSSFSRSQLCYQMESLAEICWTVQRKDDDLAEGGTVVPMQSDLDVFSRLAWESGLSRETLLCIIGNVSLIGRKHHTSPEVLAACGKFVLACLARCVTVVAGAHDEDAVLDQLELQAEAANGLIDMFSFDECDATVYIPLGVHGQLLALLPVLKRAVQQMKRASAASPRTRATVQLVRDVATNLEAFVQYKKHQNPSL